MKLRDVLPGVDWSDPKIAGLFNPDSEVPTTDVAPCPHDGSEYVGIHARELAPNRWEYNLETLWCRACGAVFFEGKWMLPGRGA